MGRKLALWGIIASFSQARSQSATTMRKTELLEDQALSTRVKVEAITLRAIRMPLVHFFETSFGRTYSRRIILVTAHCDGGDGCAESVAVDDPYYSSDRTPRA